MLTVPAKVHTETHLEDATYEPANRHETTLTATALLESRRLSAFRTGCDAVDDLIYSSWNKTDRHRARDPDGGLYEEARGEAGSIVPGMTLEISGPPGGGKTSMVVAIAISALAMMPLGELSAMPEVLLVGEFASQISELLLNRLQIPRVGCLPSGSTKPSSLLFVPRSLVGPAR